MLAQQTNSSAQMEIVSIKDTDATIVLNVAYQIPPMRKIVSIFHMFK